MLHHRALSLCIGLAMIGIGHAQAPAPAASPQATSPEPKPGPTAGAPAGSLRLTLRAALVDKDLNVKPVPRFALRIYRTEEPASGTEIRTTLAGTAEVDLPPGNYRVESVRPLAYQGKSYSWRVDVSLSRSGQSCFGARQE